MVDHYKFGDVVEWVVRDKELARWIVICHTGKAGKYMGVWIGTYEDMHKVGKVDEIGVEYGHDGAPYLVSRE